MGIKYQLCLEMRFWTYLIRGEVRERKEPKRLNDKVYSDAKKKSLKVGDTLP